MANPLFGMLQQFMNASDLAAAERQLEATLDRITGLACQADYFVPLTIQKQAALQAFHQWLQGLKFVPANLKRTADLGALTTYYVPFWSVRSMTSTTYHGEKGEEYKTNEQYTDASGETKTREVTQTEWQPVHGEVRHLFDDLHVCAAMNFHEQHVHVLKPRDLKKCQACGPDWKEDPPRWPITLEARAGFSIARGLMEKEIRTLVQKDIGGKQQRVSRMEPRHLGVDMKLVMIPAYVGSYRYGGKEYQVVINGATGEVSGDYPMQRGQDHPAGRGHPRRLGRYCGSDLLLCHAPLGQRAAGFISAGLADCGYFSSLPLAAPRFFLRRTLRSLRAGSAS